MKTFKLKSGVELPLIQLKGKDYLLVGHRLVWLSEEAERYEVFTEFPLLNDEQTVARATVTLLDERGQTLRKASATKRETKKDFSDHTEKAETGALGRALAMLGFGTQFAQQDLDEGDRLADAPLAPTEKRAPAGTTSSPSTDTTSEEKPAAKVSSFRRNTSSGGGWS